jgi:ABC-type transporter Mla subunit MlaD
MLDFATNAARSVLGQIGVVEHRVENLGGVEEKLHGAVEALHRTADSLDRHVEAMETVADQLPELTAAVTRLVEQLSAALAMAAPVEAAEREVESGLRRLFHLGRRRGGPGRGALPPAPGA